MTTDASASHEQLVRELGDEYRSKGYEVIVEPSGEDVPFDLSGYRPDLLIRKAGEQLLVEVKSSTRQLSVDRFQKIAEEVGRHSGWRFLLVTKDDLNPLSDTELLEFHELKHRAERAGQLLDSGDFEAAILILWSSLDGLLRLRAMQESIPVERMQTLTLIRHLYSQGVLSFEQYESLARIMPIRNQVAHGYKSTNVTEAARNLLVTTQSILREWACGNASS